MSYYTKASPLRSSLRKHGGRQKSPGRKTVSFVSSNTDKKISNVNDCLQFMQNGTEMVKLRTNTRQFRRVFSLDADLSHIRWTPTNKKPHKARIAVDTIKEVRVGRNTELLRATTEGTNGETQDEGAFSVIYGDDYMCLDLIALSADDANIWVTGLMALTSGPKDIQPSGSMATLRERWLESVFDNADTEKKGYISEKSAARLIRSINPRLLVTRCKQRVKEVSTSCTNEALRGRIDREQFIDIYKDVATRPEVYFLMVRYANKDYLSIKDLQIFLETEQGMVGVTKEECEKIIQQYEPSTEAKKNHFMTVDGFTNFLLSDESSVFDQSQKTVCHEMDHHFSKYFIATSHNTYLVEDQIKGPSSVDGYISALKRSCRFIELDVWEPSEHDDVDELMIYHGGTDTSKLPLTAALTTISELAFEHSNYPLLIRLEQHLSLAWQHRLVDALLTHLGTQLYLPFTDPIDWTLPDNVPTPEKFKNKIILVGKRLPKQFQNGSSNVESGEVTEEDESCDIQTGKQRRERRTEILAELSNLIAPFMQTKQVRDLASFTSKPELSSATHVVSITEGDCLKMIHHHSAAFSELGRNYALRVIPNAVRVDSSNMNPQEFWNFGLNMVALNYQTPGLMMDLQEGKFGANGACGYVLKPAVMREDVFTPHEKLPIAPQILHLKILSAQQLPRPRGSNAKGDSADPFVVIEIFGIPADCAEERTKTIRNDSFNPSFDESFQFEISVPELALVRFLVLDDDYIGDDFIGQYTVPFECLQSGYRHIPLLNNEGDPLENSTLFVHVAITNRRGGGKPKKRGMSVKRKTSRVQTGMKMIGIKAMDDLFKMAVSPLVESIEMRNQLEGAMVEWQEQCGLGQTGTIRQGLRLVHSRIVTAASSATPPTSPHDLNAETKNEDLPPGFVISKNNEGHPIVKTMGAIPDAMLKSFSSLDNLLKKCISILDSTDILLAKLSEATARISEYYLAMPQQCADAGLRGQKATRASENFAWNVRLLKAQLTLMNKTQTEANEIVFQVVDTAKILGVFDPSQ
uniref:Phosphoinositide phospholipase C n=1 Tax=Panagrellus redivivus TaxID=6233 RepID=A0A7E4VQ00_PANRE